jgi:tetratricopeptide (TPR) repeat protein
MTVRIGEFPPAQFIISFDRDLVEPRNRRSGADRSLGRPVNAQAPSGTYPGNPSLPVEVREKIVSTFRHTLDLFRDGKLDDCLIGCDFILKMDPRFAPARKLQEKARNPKADVDMNELQAVISSPTAAVARPSVEGAASQRRETGAAPHYRRDTGSVAALGPLKRETEPVLPPDDPFPPAESSVPLEGLEDLSLDSLSLDGPLPDLAVTTAGETGLPFEAAGGANSGFEGLTQGSYAEDPALASPQALSPADEIAALLRKGDDARVAGDKQQAIEIWSRIFLIDINNGDAVARIEAARREMAEESQRIAASLDKGEVSFAKGDLAAARTEFDAVLSLGQEPPAPAAAAAPVAIPASPGLPPHDLSAVAAPGDVLAEELDQSGPPGGRRSWTSIPRPPRDSAPEGTGSAAAEPAARRFALPVSPRVAMIAAAGLVVLALAAFFLLRSSGGAGSPPAGEPAGPSLERATRLFQEGKIEETTAELKRIPPDSPEYARAQKLLASLTDSKPAPAAPSSAGAPAGSRAAMSADPAVLRADAERALAEKRYIDAMKSFSQAAPAFQADPTFTQQMAAASEKVSELTPAVKLYNDGEYETAIPILWRIYQASRDNQDARSYLMRSYFNQGILQLQNGLFDRAKESFSEVLALDPQDVEAGRHRQFAERYRSGELDLLGRIYVRYVSPRP